MNHLSIIPYSSLDTFLCLAILYAPDLYFIQVSSHKVFSIQTPTVGTTHSQLLTENESYHTHDKLCL